jgi:hypothetical protein
VKLPRLDNPQRYVGLYVYDFGERAAVGYTAEEIQVLQASPEHGAGHAYRICSATADGQLMLRGVARIDSSSEEGMIFFQSGEPAARGDFEDLKDRAQSAPPPCVVHWHLASDEQLEYVHFTMLRYEAEHSDAVGQWLLQIGFMGGVRVDCGPRVVSYYQGGRIRETERVAIAPHASLRSRPRWEVLATVGQPIQREL